MPRKGPKWMWKLMGGGDGECRCKSPERHKPHVCKYRKRSQEFHSDHDGYGDDSSRSKWYGESCSEEDENEDEHTDYPRDVGDRRLVERLPGPGYDNHRISDSPMRGNRPSNRDLGSFQGYDRNMRALQPRVDLGFPGFSNLPPPSNAIPGGSGSQIPGIGWTIAQGNTGFHTFSDTFPGMTSAQMQFTGDPRMLWPGFIGFHPNVYGWVNQPDGSVTWAIPDSKESGSGSGSTSQGKRGGSSSQQAKKAGSTSQGKKSANSGQHLIKSDGKSNRSTTSRSAPVPSNTQYESGTDEFAYSVKSEVDSESGSESEAHANSFQRRSSSAEEPKHTLSSTQAKPRTTQERTDKPAQSSQKEKNVSGSDYGKHGSSTVKKGDGIQSEAADKPKLTGKPAENKKLKGMYSPVTSDEE